MERSQLDRDAEITMLRHVTESLWANMIRMSGGDPAETTRRVAQESINALEAIYERQEQPQPGIHELIQATLHHEEAFWRSVEHQVVSRR